MVAIISLHGASLRLQIPRLHQLRFRVDVGLKLALLELLLNLLERLQVLAIGEDVMQSVKLMVPVSLLVEVIIVNAGQQLAVALNYGLDDFEEG